MDLGNLSGTYVVVRGDTLSKIAVQYDTTYQELARMNGITNPNLIRVGQVLVVPDALPNSIVINPVKTGGGAGTVTVTQPSVGRGVLKHSSARVVNAKSSSVPVMHSNAVGSSRVDSTFDIKKYALPIGVVALGLFFL